jgi:putative membrane protein
MAPSADLAGGAFFFWLQLAATRSQPPLCDCARLWRGRSWALNRGKASMVDLAFAIAHHLLVFALFGVLAAELIVVRPGIDVSAVRRISKVDVWYGVLAGLILLVGFARASMAAKGWAYYQHNAFFWAKIGTFALIGLLSIPPTLAYLRWRKAGAAPDERQVRSVRGLLYAEVLLFALLPIFAAAMARGYGELTGS